MPTWFPLHLQVVGKAYRNPSPGAPLVRPAPLSSLGPTGGRQQSLSFQQRGFTHSPWVLWPPQASVSTSMKWGHHFPSHPPHRVMKGQ